MKFIHKCTLCVAKDRRAIDKTFDLIPISECLIESTIKKRQTDKLSSTATLLKAYIPIKSLNKDLIEAIKNKPSNRELLNGNLLIEGVILNNVEGKYDPSQPDLLKVGAKLISSCLIYDFGVNAHIVVVCE